MTPSPPLQKVPYKNERILTNKCDSLSSRKRFIYRGYLQIAELDASTATESHPAILRKTYLWDPSEPTATRVLALTSYDATGTYEAELYYTHDAQKNTTALFGIQAGRRASYQYSAYGSLLKINGDLAALNPFRFSSEYHDEDLDLIYYNYRYYNPTDGRWIHRDPIQEQGGVNLYGFVRNNTVVRFDILGLYPKDVLDYLKKNCKCLRNWAGEYAVPPEAVAMAIADEYTTRNPADSIQDFLAPLGEGGSETAFGRGDIGLGNINIDTAIDILTEEMNNGGFEFQSKQEMKAYLLTVAGTMHIASAYMGKVIQNISPYVPTSMSDADQYQNYVAGWREGYEKRADKIKNNKGRIEKEGGQYSPIHDKESKQTEQDFQEIQHIIKNCK